MKVPRMRVRSRTVACALLVATACSIFDGERDTYVMTHIAGQQLPSVIRSITVLSSGELHGVDFRVAWGTLRLYDRHRFEIDSELEEVWDGTVKSSTQGPTSGTYERSATELVIRLRDIDGVNQVFTYEILDGGQRIRGRQWGRVAEYRRQ
jgi:hypothetical protein